MTPNDDLPPIVPGDPDAWLPDGQGMELGRPRWPEFDHVGPPEPRLGPAQAEPEPEPELEPATSWGWGILLTAGAAAVCLIGGIGAAACGAFSSKKR